MAPRPRLVRLLTRKLTFEDVTPRLAISYSLPRLAPYALKTLCALRYALCGSHHVHDVGNLTPVNKIPYAKYKNTDEPFYQ